MAKINKLFITLLILFFGFVITFYSFGLKTSPIHINQDELMYSLNAVNIAKTGHDFYGSYMPLYSWHLENFWANPVTTYLAALVFKFLPVTESTIRMPSVIIGIVSISLMMVLVSKIFGKRKLVFIGGVLIAISPGLYINSRLLLDNIYIVPFVLIWLITLFNFLNSGKWYNLFASGFSLGIGIHSYHAAKIYMPLYFVFTLLLFVKEKIKIKKTILFAMGFLIPLVIFLPWLKVHPDTLLSQVRYVSNVDKNFIKFDIARIAGSYLSYFNPRILFISGDATFVHSTGKTGVVVFVVVFLMMFGFVEMLKRNDNFSKLVIAGFVAFPIAPALIDDPGRVSRALVVIPFVVLISVYGVYFLLNSKERVFRKLVTVIIVLGLIEFSFFIHDYFGNYRIRSSSVFNNNISGAIDSAQKSVGLRNVEKIYLDDSIPFVSYYYKFSEIKNHANFNSWQLFNTTSSDFTKLDKGSLVVLGMVSFPKNKPDKINGFEKIETIRELDGTETFLIYFK